MNRGMAVKEVKVNLQASAYEGDHLIIGNWIIASDSKLRASRQFQVINSGTGSTLVRAKMEFVCTNLETGRPVKMPKIFAKKYAVESEIL
jgi:acyl-CoA thioester hydrolase